MSPLFQALEGRRLLSITLAIDYSLDTNNFFSSADRKSVMAAAAKAISSRLNDTLQAITPSGSNTWSLAITNPATGKQKLISNPTIAADTIPIYVGGGTFRSGSELGEGGAAGYNASGSDDWLSLLAQRGERVADPTHNSDILSAPLAGSITFDQTENWHFGLSATDLSSSQSDFLSVAEHELMHVLGFSSDDPAFASFISGTRFTGPASEAVYGGPVPLDSGLSHWREGTQSPGEGEATMDPSLTVGTRKLATSLDFAALDDIGWTVLPAGSDGLSAVISGGGQPLGEGKSVTLSATSSSVPIGATIATYEWDTDYDGATFVARASGSQITYTAADGPAAPVVALRITTATGQTSIATRTLTLTNAAPTATLSQTATAVELTAPVDVPADLPTLIYSFDLGDDGVVEQSGSSPIYTLPTVQGSAVTRSLRATVTDKDGGATSYTTLVTLTSSSGETTPPPTTPITPITLTPDPRKKGKSFVVINGTAGDDILTLTPDAHRKPQLTLNGQVLIAAASVTRLIAFLGAGNDTVALSTLKVPMLLDGGDGNDTLTAGKGKDIVIGGAGADTLHGSAGDDLLAAGEYATLSADGAAAELTAWNARGKTAARLPPLADTPTSPFSATTIPDTDIDTLAGDGGNDAYLFGASDVLPTLGKAEVSRSRN